MNDQNKIEQLRAEHLERVQEFAELEQRLAERALDEYIAAEADEFNEHWTQANE